MPEISSSFESLQVYLQGLMNLGGTTTTGRPGVQALFTAMDGTVNDINGVYTTLPECTRQYSDGDDTVSKSNDGASSPCPVSRGGPQDGLEADRRGISIRGCVQRVGDAVVDEETKRNTALLALIAGGQQGSTTPSISGCCQPCQCPCQHCFISISRLQS
jgi:hypothetical protein